MKNSIFILLLNIAFSLQAYSGFKNTSSNQATINLHDYIVKLDGIFSYYGHKEEVSLDRILEYVADGADLHQKNRSGENSLHSIIIAWVFSNPTDKEFQEYIKIINFLIKNKVSSSEVDYRGFSILSYMLFKKNLPQFKALLPLVLESNINLNRISSSYSVNRLLFQLIDANPSHTLVEKFLKSGLDLKTIKPSDGLSFAHLSAKIMKKEGGNLLLRFLMEKLNPSEQTKFSKMKSNNGSTPLHFAAMSGNLDAVKYLIEEQQVNFSIVSNNDKTPLDLALENFKPKVAKYLRMKSAAYIGKSDNVWCKKRNTYQLTYERIVDTIEKCSLKSIDELLPLLPSSYLSNHIFSHFTHAVQGASKEFPHVTTFGKDGKLLLAFNGSEKQTGYNNLEIIQFRDETKEFEMRDIKFPESKLGKVQFSKKNPARCLGCHGSKPKPLWDAWTFWPGKFGDEVDTNHPSHDDYVSTFMNTNRRKGRYKSLPDFSTDPFVTSFGHFSESWANQQFQNQKLDQIIFSLMGQKVGMEIFNSKKISDHRYLMLAALSCRDDLSGYLSDAQINNFDIAQDFLEKDTLNKAVRLFDNKLRLHESLIGEKPKSRFLYQQKLIRDMNLKGFAGDNYFVKRIARLRFVTDNLQYDTSNWFTPYNNGLESYFMDIRYTALEHEVWRLFMSVEKDNKLLALYKKQIKGSSQFYKNANFFLRSESEEKICKLLKEKKSL